MIKRILFSKHVLQAVGLVFVAVGFVGIFLPFLQGAFLILVGVYLLSFDSPALRRHVERFERHLPSMVGVRRRVEKYLSQFRSS